MNKNTTTDTTSSTVKDEMTTHNTTFSFDPTWSALKQGEAMLHLGASDDMVGPVNLTTEKP